MVDWGSFEKYVMILILVVVGFSLIAALYTEASTATDSVNASNMCSDAGCFYNDSRAVACTDTNTTPADTTKCTAAGQGEGFPLSGLFASGGILFIVIAASVLMYYLRRSK